MDGDGRVQGGLEPQVRCGHQRASMNGAQCAQLLRVVHVHVRDGVHVVHRIVLKRDIVLREGVRSVVAIYT